MNATAIKVSAVALLAVALSGCEIAARVKTNGTYEGLTNKDSSKGQVFVYREKAFAGMANQYDVMMNGTLAGSLPNGSFISVMTSPGQTKVEPRTLTSFGFGKGSTINVEAGKSYCFKLTLNFCLQCKSADINPVSTEQCERDIKSLEKVVLE